jgi:transmembrane sensor
MKNSYHINELLPSYFEGNLSDEQVQLVEAWISESTKNRKIAENIGSIYQYTDTISSLIKADEDSVLVHLHNNIMHKSRLKLFRILERVAVVLFIPLLLGSIILFINKNNVQPKMLSMMTNPGMTAKAILPDGTMVTLNSSSEITYPTEFKGDKRQVHLCGEAYFNVTKDKEHPFIVNTPQKAMVKVYGTKFDVDAYPDETTMITTLQEGSVSLSYKEDNGNRKELMLVPGEQAVYSIKEKSATITNVPADLVTSWHTGMLKFYNTPVADVLRSLSKKYGVIFVVKDPQSYSHYFTGILGNQRLERVLKYISMASNMKFKYLPDSDNGQKQLIEVY